MSSQTSFARKILDTASTERDGTGSNMVVVYNADEDGWLEKVRFMPGGTCEDAVGTVFLNNGEDQTVSPSSVLLNEGDCIAVTGSATAPLLPVDVDCQCYIEKGNRIFAGITVNQTAGYWCSAFIGKHRSDFHGSNWA